MEHEYDFSQGLRNPYTARLREEATSQVDGECAKFDPENAPVLKD